MTFLSVRKPKQADVPPTALPLEGRRILDALGMDRFVLPDPSWYQETEKLLEFLHNNGIRIHGLEPAQH
uniref:Uncharacterized protein n=1 Tax=Desulfacinum infernum TaxID=35837 RepID=A0A831ZZ58_9BACT